MKDQGKYSDERGGKLSFSFFCDGGESFGEEAGLSERETARLHGVRGTHSQGHVLA